MVQPDKTYIIAEIGVNHNGDVELAKKHIDAAHEACADAVKFQCYTTEALVTDAAPQADYQVRNTGRDESQSAMLARYELSHNYCSILKEYTESKALDFIATPYDKDSVYFLISLGLEIFKISSGDITNFPLLKCIAQTGKTVILSTGASTMDEVHAAENLILRYTQDLYLLHCTSCYPTEIEEVNLKAMQTMIKECMSPIGLSDHTTSVNISIAAVALGARVIERHLTLDKNMPGPDHKASLEPHELKYMVQAIREVEGAMGSVEKKPCLREQTVREYGRRSLIASQAISKGAVITEDMLIAKRPGEGISPDKITEIIGQRSKYDLSCGHILTEDDIEKV